MTMTEVLTDISVPATVNLIRKYESVIGKHAYMIHLNDGDSSQASFYLITGITLRQQHGRTPYILYKVKCLVTGEDSIADPYDLIII